MVSKTVLLATAIESVLRAGDMQLAHFNDSVRIEKKGVIDLVTEVDIAIETAFRETIAERFPEHEVLGEELQNAGANSTATHVWIFDPIDGTTNYAHGFPVFCSSLALQIDGRTQLGAIYDPIRRELFTAEKGGGAFLNGLPLKVSLAEALIDSLLCTGFPYDVHLNYRQVMNVFEAFLTRARAVRRLGSAALDLCYVAAGRLDGFWEERLQPWDIAAGALIVEEAGGCTTTLDGSPFDPHLGQVLASNGLIHLEMIETISQANAGQK